MNLNRRNFIRMLGSGLLVPIIEPKIVYILPPENGWKNPALRPNFAKLMIPGMIQIYYDYLEEHEAFTLGADVDLSRLKQDYLDKRANAIFTK